MSSLLGTGAHRQTRLPGAARSTVLWVATMWALLILLQRFTIPGMPVTILIPVAALWAVWGMARGLVEFDRARLGLWSLAFGSAAVLVVVQGVVLPSPTFRITSILLFSTVWLPFVLRLRDRRLSTYVTTLRVISYLSAILAIVAAAMMASQLLGVRYTDWFGEAVPKTLQYPPSSFVISYPIEYGSPIYRANAWIGLEPSFVSAQIGLGIIAGVLSRVRWGVLVVLFVGMLCTTAGSGFLIVAAAALVMVFSRMRSALLRYLPLAVLALVSVFFTDLGQNLLSRLSEGGQSRSSTSLRTLLPYTRFWPEWTEGLGTVLLGRGPGSAEDMLDIFNVTGLLAPTPVKVFFEYGLLVGTLIAAFMLFAMFRGPSRSLAFTLAFSLWTLQPGSTTFLIVAPAFLLVTLWAPRIGLPIEHYVDLPGENDDDVTPLDRKEALVG